ncbi:DUF1987 domain-containing protein [Thiosulfativibrio zosterae]|nr:DUF1987 domain-containing protein [Thiosulfativibrio zosterae]
MNELLIEETQYTPSIKMSPEGQIEIKGKSYPENTFEFYKPVMVWLTDYFVQDSVPSLKVKFEITYFNSSSSKLFFDFFDLLNEHKDSVGITIDWCYDEENESAMEAGEDFIDDFPDLSIKLVTV